MAQNNEERIRFASDEIVTKHNLDLVVELFAADYVAHAGEAKYKGTSFVKKYAGQLRTALPDLRAVKVEILNQAGDTIAWQRTLSGTHKADMMGIPPSGKKVKWMEMVVTRFAGGKIAEEWVVSELAGALVLKLPAA